MRVTTRDDEPTTTPSVYFTHAYGAANAEHVGGRWITIADRDGRWQMPLILRQDDAGVIDASSPYGYAGIHADPSLVEHELRHAWQDTRETLRELGVTSVFVRFAPFLPRAAVVAARLPDMELEHVSDTVSVPVRDIDATWTALQGRARTAIRKATSKGLVGDVEEVPASLGSADDPFRMLYESTMSRLDARATYYFEDGYYQRLLDHLRHRTRLATVRKSDGALAAAALVLCDDSVVHYHLAGSDPEAARDGANNLLIWSILEWSALHGFEAVHLGGGVRPDDGLFRFKESFGGNRLPFHVGRFVVDLERYEQLVLDRARVLRCGPDELAQTGFFPAYRAEVAHAH